MMANFRRLTAVLVLAFASSTWAKPVPFLKWVAQFKKEAAKAGISDKTLEVLDKVKVVPRAIELDRKQPEGVMTFEDYQKRVLKPERVTEGKRLLALHKDAVEKASVKFGVEPEFIVALWGVETHFGTQMGDFSIPSALATLAWDGRRAKLFRAQLLDALRILDRGDIEPEAMKGSWAGAMGNCQFMPSTFLNYAVDMDNDGRRDLWKSLPDVFGSAANYLSKVGWKKGRGWGMKVTVPKGFDEALVGRKVKKTLTEWKALGVTAVDGAALGEGAASMSLVRPGGKSTQLFLVQGNYHVLLRWNNSEYFATVVSLLAQAIATPVAEPKKEANYLCGETLAGGESYTFRETKVYSEPKPEARILAVVPAAHPIKLLAGDGFCQENWYEMNASMNGKQVSGYLKGEELALTAVALSGSAKDKPMLLVGYEPSERIKLQLRVYQSSAMLSDTSLEPTLFDWGSFSGYQVSASALGSKGLGSGFEAVVLHLRYDACGYSNPDILLLWNGRKLVPGPTAYNASDAGEFSTTSRFVFPSDSRGRPNIVQVETTTQTEFSDATGNFTREEIESQFFSWNGTEIVEQTKPPAAKAP